MIKQRPSFTIEVISAVCVIGLLTASDALAQQNKDVNVANQPTVHLAPATSVAINGTPSVTISGTPAVAISGTPTVAISGTPTVGISGTPTVQIGNTDAAAVPVRDVNYRAQDPVMLSHGPLTMGDGVASVQGPLFLSSSAAVGLPNVPAGKRLVAQFISVDVTVPAGQNVSFAVTNGLGNASIGLYIALPPPQRLAGFDVYRTSQPILVFADPLWVVNVVLDRFPSTGFANAIVGMTGYLVDVP